MFRQLRILANEAIAKTRSIMASITTEAASVTTPPTEQVESKNLYRVKVLNLPERDISSVKKFFQSLGYKRYKKAPAWDYAFLTFDSEPEARAAIQKLEGLEFKKKTLTTEYMVVSEESFRQRFQARKRKADEDAEEDSRAPAERLAAQVTPLYNMSYEEQLKKKRKTGVKHMMHLKQEISKIRKEASEQGKAQIAWSTEKFPFEVLDPIGSPEVNGYRTKCEFTIGKNLEGEPTVGFLLGLYRHGITSVLGVQECLHVPDITKRVAKAMEAYVRNSPYPVYDKVEKTGVWRTLMVKAQKTGDLMVMVQIKTSDLTEEQVAEEKKKLIDYWNSFQDKPDDEKINVKTLLLQVWNGDSNGITDKGQDEVLTGDGYVYEELLGCRFRISSSAFFQVNTPATELLYSKCAEWCNIDKNKKTTLLDLCCGTGTIGITMARTVDRVIGIEMVPEAIVDAKANAELNNITNVEYYASKVEDRIDIVSSAKNEDVVAVLDPPRNGVHSSVIRAVRESPQIKRIVYISCDAKQAMQNFISLCRPTSNRYQGVPFKPSRFVTIDLFPHTDHSELMIEFVRVEDPDVDMSS